MKNFFLCEEFYGYQRKNTLKLWRKSTLTQKIETGKIGKSISYSIQHCASSIIIMGAKLRVGGFCISSVGKSPVIILENTYVKINHITHSCLKIESLITLFLIIPYPLLRKANQYFKIYTIYVVTGHLR